MSRTDRLTGDLERGFEALEAGDFDAAEQAVERARKIDRHHPDVVQLGAALAEATGDVDAALELYEKLQEARPDDPMPRICIARIELHGLGDPVGALKTLAEAFEFIDDEDDLLEAIMIKAESYIAQEQLPAAREALAELASSVIDDPAMALDLAELSLMAEDIAGAHKWLDAALAAAPDDKALRAEAKHLLGRVCEAADDRAGMIAAWQEVRAIDATAPAGDLHVSDDEVERIAQEALGALPENVRDALAKVPILIDTVPSEADVADGLDPRLLGLFAGSPAADDLAPTVTNIRIFKTNLERSALDEDHLADEIRITVLHETAHYFGLDEEDLVEIGLD
ncbi:MAG TPA: metallopeptidase family protein [Kofleriaceae bacterium]|jgi:predicted Zn-dependent protease with MMP-like domain/thioredoxin-like negative regulator of GroEL